MKQTITIFNLLKNITVSLFYFEEKYKKLADDQKQTAKYTLVDIECKLREIDKQLREKENE